MDLHCSSLWLQINDIFQKKQKIESIYIINNVKLILLFSQER